MSRVDEAMRRAAGEAPHDAQEPEAQVVAPSAAEMADVSVLSRTLFPVEMPDRHRVRSSVGTAHVAEPAKAPDEPAADPSSGSLLDRIDTRFAQKLVIDRRVPGSSREQYRRLAASLHHAQAATGAKVVMIASALPGEGKTLTASNLGLTFSDSYQRSVLLIDGDLRRPSLHEVFGVDNTFGLADGLASPKERRVPLQQVSSRLAILTAGVGSADPMAGLTSERMRRVLDEARESFDWVIIDTPPVAFLSDANLLARMVDVAILVVKAGETAFDLVQRAIDAIGRERIAGVVLNRADPSEDATGYAYYDQYYPSQKETQEQT
jgi:capsular exopolysaccharide synthesis family protein